MTAAINAAGGRINCLPTMKMIHAVREVRNAGSKSAAVAVREGSIQSASTT